MSGEGEKLTSEMVERVAGAIASNLGLDLAGLYQNKAEWIEDRGARHDINTPYRTDIIDAARAAIGAMREPTEEMIEAYCRKHQELGFTSWANASTVLPAMIDAALQGSRP